MESKVIPGSWPDDPAARSWAARGTTQSSVPLVIRIAMVPSISTMPPDTAARGFTLKTFQQIAAKTAVNVNTWIIWVTQLRTKAPLFSFSQATFSAAVLPAGAS